jgi:hypothetical protein
MPTTSRGRFAVAPYTRTAAQIITALLDLYGDTVPRAPIRAAWYRRYPQQQRTLPGKGPVGNSRIKNAIRDLERRGVLERRHDIVRVLDRETLAQLSRDGMTDPTTTTNPSTPTTGGKQ